MLGSLATLALVVLSVSSQETDTTFAVRSGARLSLSNLNGDVAVEAWSKSAMRIEASHPGNAWIAIENHEGLVDVKARWRRGGQPSVDFKIWVPKWMAMELSGVNTEISIQGSAGTIKAQTVRGDVQVNGGSEYISLGSIEGGIELSNARGRIEVSSVNEGIRLSDVSGEISAETVNGDLELLDIDSKSVEASTVNGEVTYSGAIKDGGRYNFSTHNGDVVVAIPERVNVTVSVQTFSGDFGSAMPVRLTELSQGKRFSFTLGTGAAHMELASFQGSIRLVRPGELSGDGHGKHKSKSADHDEDPDEDPDDENP